MSYADYNIEDQIRQGMSCPAQGPKERQNSRYDYLIWRKIRDDQSDFNNSNAQLAQILQAAINKEI